MWAHGLHSKGEVSAKEKRKCWCLITCYTKNMEIVAALQNSYKSSIAEAILTVPKEFPYQGVLNRAYPYTDLNFHVWGLELRKAQKWCCMKRRAAA